MKRVLFLVSFVLIQSCSSMNTTMKVNEESTVILGRNEVHDIEGVRVACYNFAVTWYNLEDGKRPYGRTAKVSILQKDQSSKDVRVGTGSKFEIQGKTWLVEKVNETDMVIAPLE